jgi:glycosyltransferase involved in cell wall biosynthesis
MTIFYFISTVGHGMGGHFHSLNTVANAMNSEHKVFVINIGSKPSEVFKNSKYNFLFFKFNGYNLPLVAFRLMKIILKLQPDVLHAFDLESFFFVRICNLFGRRKQFLNKCGGPNPKNYFPRFSNIILFSLENFNYFNSKFRHSKIFLIPNRVNTVKCDTNRIEEFYRKHGVANFDLLRISRIGKHYEISIKQALNLLELLKKENLNVRLLVIGTVQDIKVYDRLLEYSNSLNLSKDVIFETNDIFTNKASELLPLGKMVIGTGRNFMEAASLNLPLMVPSELDAYPILVDNLNFMEVFETNFSPRTIVKTHDLSNNIEQVKRIVDGELIINTRKWFDEYFSSSQVLSKYSNAYENAKQTSFRDNISGLLLHTLKCIKPFIFK